VVLMKSRRDSAAHVRKKTAQRDQKEGLDGFITKRRIGSCCGKAGETQTAGKRGGPGKNHSQKEIGHTRV